VNKLQGALRLAFQRRFISLELAITITNISEYTKHCQSIGLSHSIGDASVSVGVVMNEVDLK